MRWRNFCTVAECFRFLVGEVEWNANSHEFFFKQRCNASRCIAYGISSVFERGMFEIINSGEYCCSQ